MRSPGNRVVMERGLRAAALLLLAFCAWALATRDRHAGRVSATDGAVAAGLKRWSRAASLDSLTLALRTAPGRLERDWLTALVRAGTAVSWHGDLPATAVEMFRIADPAGAARVLVAAPAGATVRLTDSLGTLDSARAARTGAAFVIPAQYGAIEMNAAGQRALAGAADTLMPRRAVVLGGAGWESRFVVSALEERGWIVETRLAVAPGITVTQGQPVPLDTARHAVVIVLDSVSLNEAAALNRYLAAGGGAVLAPAAARSMQPIAAGRVGEHVRAPLVAPAGGEPRNALALDPVLPRADAVVLERRRGHVVLAARRHSAGRVVQVGYLDTWRWRMSNTAGGDDQHRDWWSDVVAAAAYRAASGERGTGNGEGAPLAFLTASLGPPRGAGASAAVPDLRRLLPLAASLLFACLLAEWASRRLRGAA